MILNLSVDKFWRVLVDEPVDVVACSLPPEAAASHLDVLDGSAPVAEPAAVTLPARASTGLDRTLDRFLLGSVRFRPVLVNLPLVGSLVVWELDDNKAAVGADGAVTLGVGMTLNPALNALAGRYPHYGLEKLEVSQHKMTQRSRRPRSTQAARLDYPARCDKMLD